MKNTPKDGRKSHPKPNNEGGGGLAERQEREKNQGSLVDKTDDRKGPVTPLPIPPPPD
ncbi:MAG: hypothetical protein Q8M26_05680 [Pseudolabrys sp.]|nr:hypothetical protein [Pseudolabrys sp.]